MSSSTAAYVTLIILGFVTGMVLGALWVKYFDQANGVINQQTARAVGIVNAVTPPTDDVAPINRKTQIPPPPPPTGSGTPTTGTTTKTPTQTGGGGGQLPPHIVVSSCGCGDDGDPSSIPAYRVQGGGSKVRILVTEEGNIQIVGNEMLHLNFGSLAHALKFLAQRAADAYIVTFDVRYEFLEVLRGLAVPQSQGRGSPYPQIEDPTQGPDLYGIRSNLFPELLEYTIPGSARIIRSDDLLGGGC